MSLFKVEVTLLRCCGLLGRCATTPQGLKTIEERFVNIVGHDKEEAEVIECVTISAVILY